MDALAGVGAASRRRSRYEPLRSLALGASCVAFLVSLLGVAATVATDAGWDVRSFDRAIRPADFFPDEEPAFLWTDVLEVTEDLRPFSVVYLAPLTGDAVPPPGLDRWPQASEVIASPAMLGRAEAERYGTVVGTIATPGLLEDLELLVYVGGGDRLTETNAHAATGWGSEFGDRIGSDVYRAPGSQLLWLLAVFLVTPAAWFLLNAARIGGSQRARRVAVLRLLGARPGDIRRMLWGESRTPLLVAWAIAAGVAGVASVIDLPVIGTGFTLRAVDLREAWPLVLVTLLAGAAVSSAVAVSPVGLRGERRRTGAQPRATWLRASAAPVATALGFIAVNLAVASAAIDLVPIVFGATMLATIALLPVSTRSWLALVARRGRRRAWQAGDAGGVTGAAQLAAAPAPAARFGATAAIIVILVTFGYSFAQALGGSNTEARALRDRLGDDVATVAAWQQADESAWNQALGSLRTQYAVAELRVDHSADNGILRALGTRDDLDRLGLAADVPPPAWIDPGAVEHVEVEVGPIRPLIDGSAVSLAVARRDGLPVDREALKDTLAGLSVPTWNAELPGDGWVVGTQVSLDQARWVPWLGGIGVVLSLLALWVSYSNELLRASRSLLALQVLAPDRRFVLDALAWRILAPVGVAVVGGSGLALLLVAPLTTADYRLPIEFVVFCALAAVGTGGVALAATVRACTGAAETLSLGIPEE